MKRALRKTRTKQTTDKTNSHTHATHENTQNNPKPDTHTHADTQNKHKAKDLNFMDELKR